MHYTIITGESNEGTKIAVSLEKSGNVYIVAVWNREICSTIERNVYSDYSAAESAFFAKCKMHNVTEIEEPRQTWSAEYFD